jgi:hypothetical protein
MSPRAIVVSAPYFAIAVRWRWKINLPIPTDSIGSLPPVTAPSHASRPRAPEEIRAWLDSLAQFSDKIPELPEKISRDWIYQDHN